VVSTGPNRGQAHCFVCETEDRPAVIVFARTMNDALGQLLKQLDQAAAQPEMKELRLWATFLNEDQPAFDPKLVEWSRQLGLRHIPLGVFEDRKGPPQYRLSAEADVTLLLAINQKVMANFAFRPGELKDAKSKEVLDALARLVPKSPAGQPIEKKPDTVVRP
jgi:hypothetical protein